METIYRKHKILTLATYFDGSSDFQVTQKNCSPEIYENTRLERVCEKIDEEIAEEDENRRYSAQEERGND